MLSYRHSFHAGNHADVLKHIVLTLTIAAYKEKETPFLYLDTHAGAGRYLLNSSQAIKIGEFYHGILPIWQQRSTMPPLLQPYFSVIKHYNSTEQLMAYPGSPLIAKQLLRPQDTLHLTELHTSDYDLLKKEFSKDKRSHVLKDNGYQQLKSQLPPASRRGIILIDPSYELKDDYYTTIAALKEGYKRFSTGTYLLWYPVIYRQQVKKMLSVLTATTIKKILQIELAVKPDNDQKGMTASGMIVINPPWKLAEQMEILLPYLIQMINPAKYGHTFVNWLVPE